MTNVPVPVPTTATPGNFLTSALWNAQVRDAVTFLVNPPMFFAYSTIAVSLAANVFAVVGLDYEVFDTYGGHSTVSNTSRYVAQVSGVYEVTGAVSIPPSSGGLIGGYIAKNGSQITGSGIEVEAMSGHYNGVPLQTVPVRLNAGDYVELYVLSGAAGTTASGGPYCSLYVRFVNP